MASVAALLVLVVLVLAAPPTPTVQRVSGRLVVELGLNRAVYVTGEPVAARVLARVDGDSPVRVQFRSSQRFDLIIRRRGVLIWRWSYDRAFLQVLGEVVLRPGEPLAFEATWEQVDLQGRRVEPGEYDAVGVFLGRASDGGEPIETPALPFRIRSE